MHNKLNILTIVFVMIAFLVMPAIAQKPGMEKGKPDSPGKNGQAGKSNVAHLYFYEKTGDPDWEIVEDGVWDKMKYNLTGPEFDFVFNGHGLETGSTYTSIFRTAQKSGSF